MEEMTCYKDLNGKIHTNKRECFFHDSKIKLKKLIKDFLEKTTLDDEDIKDVIECFSNLKEKKYQEFISLVNTMRINKSDTK